MLVVQEKLSEEKQDSFWYDEGAVLVKGNFTVYALGEIKVTIDNEVYNEYQALEYAEEHNFTDKDLEKFEFLMNNWFEILDNTGGDNTGIICYSYNEAEEELIKLNQLSK